MCNQLFAMTNITVDFVHVLIAAACLINSFILLLSVYIPRYLSMSHVLYIIGIVVCPRVIIIGIL